MRLRRSRQAGLKRERKRKKLRAALLEGKRKRALCVQLFNLKRHLINLSCSRRAHRVACDMETIALLQ